MALNEGEQAALLTQVETLRDSTEVKLRRLGLPWIKVGLYDERTRQPINSSEAILAMSEEARGSGH